MLFSITAQDTPEKHQHLGHLSAHEGLSKPHAKILLAANNITNINTLMSNEQVATLDDAVKVGTTTFVTESTIQEQSFNENPHTSTILPIMDQGLADFLNKPYAVYSGTWTTSSVSNDTLYTSKVAPFLTSVTQWQKKLEGFNLVRGKACIRVVINANPFQQGKLILSFVPDIGQVTFRNGDLCQKTQQPNVELDCRDATCLMKVPYIAPTDYYDRVRGFFDWGTFTLSVLSPLQVGSGGENNVNYTIFLYFEDFELAAPMVPQAGYARRPRGVTSVESHAEKEATAITETHSVSRGLQMGADVVSKIAEIPMLTSIAEPASWILRGASKIAAWFGWSKPEVDSPPCVSSRRLITNMANATGASVAPSLGLFHDNAVDVMPDMAGNGMDEMSFDYIKSRKAYYSVSTWTDTNAADSVLFTQNIAPQFFNLPLPNYAPGVTIYETASLVPFAYVSNFFTFWRGSINLHLKFAKTDFHSGRLLITFTPNTLSFTAPTVQSSILALREIVDIRGKSEVLLKLPYLINTNYLRTDQFSGVLQIRVLNELRAPETCSNSIKMLFYASAGDDFEVQVPGTTNSQSNPPFMPQVGGVQPDVNQELVDEPIGGYIIPKFDMEPCRTSIGECFASIKQLFSRYTPLQTITPISFDSTAAIGIFPYYFGVCRPDPTTGAPLVPNYNSDALSNFASGYAFYRGSVKIMARSRLFVDADPMAILDNQAYVGGPVIVPGSTYGGNGFDQTASPYNTPNVINPVAEQIYDSSIGLMEVKVPYYCQTKMSVVDSLAITRPESQSDPCSMLYLGIDSDGTGTPPTGTMRLYRCASDEFQLAYFIGFPRILLNII